MTDSAALGADSRPSLVPSPAIRTALVEFAFAVGGFGIGTGEFATMGLLPNVAGSLGVSEPTAGNMISAYALGVVVGSPIIAVLAAKMARRTLLLGLMLLFAIGNVLTALAPSFGMLVGLRFFTGMPHGAYFGVASLVVASMAAPGKRTQAVGRVMLGLTIAILVGTPGATWLGQTLGWRASFAVIGSLGLLTAALILFFVPRDKPIPGASPLRELSAFRRKQVWLTAGIAAVGCGGIFSVFSYITSTLTQVTHMPDGFVPVVLCIFGVGMILGNVVGSALADRALMPLIGGMLVWFIVMLSAFVFTAPYPIAATINILLIGCGFAIVPGLQTRLMDVAADAQTLAAALNHSAFNIANALGASLGGLTIAAGFGWTSTAWVGALLALGGLGVFIVSLLTDEGTAVAPVGTESRAAIGH
jgi:DHA1 family inner membrane transport protein